MSEQDAQAVRARLETMRGELMADRENLPIAEGDEVSDFGAGQHNADDGTDTFLRERNLALRGNADEIVGQIDAALGRLDDGSYGTCERCGQPIGAERLEALPYTTLCINCAREQAA